MPQLSSHRQIIRQFPCFCMCAFKMFLCLSVLQTPLNGQDDLAKSATWKIADVSSVNSAFEAWMLESNTSEQSKARVREFLERVPKSDSSNDTIDWLMDVIVIARPDVNQVREQLSGQRTGITAPDFSVIFGNPEEKDFLRDHVRLYLARWLVQNEFYDEALVHFALLNIESSLDPASMLFYRSLVEHQLLKKDDCLKSVNRLLENSSQLPRRYSALAKLMLADLEPLEPDSLDEIARMMNDIRRRTGLYRSGKLVIDEEEKVIKKLDKLIEELEAQQASSNTKPGSPMEDSMKAGGQGTGETTSKRLPEGGDWGDLPPADRAAALADMAKDMPPHYRAVIEEYFRQLAKENER